MEVFIYALSDPRTREIRYVGKTVNLRQRVYGHLNDRENTWKSNWIESLKKHGLKPEIEVLEIFFDESETKWKEAEMWWIAYLKFIGCPLTNLDGGGDGGKMMRPESREKVRQSKLGIPRSEECKRKLREANLGKKQSPETIKKKIEALKGRKGHPMPEWLKEKMRRINTGCKWTQERKDAMSLRQTGRKHSEASKEKRRQKMTGQKRTPEQIEKIRLSQIGKNLSESHRINISKGLHKFYGS